MIEHQILEDILKPESMLSRDCSASAIFGLDKKVWGGLVGHIIQLASRGFLWRSLQFFFQLRIFLLKPIDDHVGD
jgi:hypothetical protein